MSGAPKSSVGRGFCRKGLWPRLDRPRAPVQSGTASTTAGNSGMISGRTELIAHLGYPTESFTAPMIYNPWFAHRGIDAVVVPMGVRAGDYAAFLRPLFRLSNIRGALVTMP